MEQRTKVVPHPTIPGATATIRYVSRADVLRANADVDRKRKPIAILDPNTGEPLFNKQTGEPFYIFKADVSQNAASDHIARYVVGFDGIQIGGVVVPSEPKNFDALLHESFDVEIEIDTVDEKTQEKGKQKVKVSWALALDRASRDIATFDPDPKANGSATL